MRLLSAALLLGITASPALAQREPEIVIPGRPDVPVYINGIDASWGIVEGEFGLDRPGLMAPAVTYRPLILSNYPTEVAPFFPNDNKRPGYGRLEIIPPPNRPLPPPAPTYYRSWSAGSAPGPVTQYPPYPMPNIDVYTGWGGGRRHSRHHDHTPGPGSGPGFGPGPGPAPEGP